MSSLTETILVAVVVAVAGAWAGWSIWRFVRSKGTCSSCSSSGGCPMVKPNGDLVELEQNGPVEPVSLDCPTHKKD